MSQPASQQEAPRGQRRIRRPTGSRHTRRVVTADRRRLRHEPEGDIAARWKTQLCAHWRTKGRCAHGTDCGFAHGEGELRSLPQGDLEAAEASQAPARQQACSSDGSAAREGAGLRRPLLPPQVAVILQLGVGEAAAVGGRATRATWPRSWEQVLRAIQYYASLDPSFLADMMVASQPEKYED